MVAVPVQSELTWYVPVSASNSVPTGWPSTTTKSTWVNFPFPSKSVIATPFWLSTTPGPGRNTPEISWPYLPFSEAFEHVPACASDAPDSVRHATVAASVALQNEAFMVFLSYRFVGLGHYGLSQ